jgi:hypothetical protein
MEDGTTSMYVRTRAVSSFFRNHDVQYIHEFVEQYHF